MASRVCGAGLVIHITTCLATKNPTRQTASRSQRPSDTNQNPAIVRLILVRRPPRNHRAGCFEDMARPTCHHSPPKKIAPTAKPIVTDSNNPRTSLMVAPRLFVHGLIFVRDPAPSVETAQAEPGNEEGKGPRLATGVVTIEPLAERRADQSRHDNGPTDETHHSQPNPRAVLRSLLRPEPPRGLLADQSRKDLPGGQFIHVGGRRSGAESPTRPLPLPREPFALPRPRSGTLSPIPREAARDLCLQLRDERRRSRPLRF